ncbi:NADP-dependent oxidoreductase [Streptosporangium roseum]|uniref:Alcohol dehydrogenase zinc-binding domain protein n=1 Tax=Streptosporangium roseum (strain ATCC 12428 / DSM 43021 / JCM 3005 / KCTC 9067 / NCIMB 10171 / NRRL 2505 / NI 9100) TaxID=479432 RepID=D2BEC0_STRRD|nr:NADP-dependent oxidoreductase [Streptosporangium roseum]ACZ91957.1 alcohol dehydrogenase zinc-binding domain protein [Streptosporangium roseum DSM 43021]
MRAVVVRSFGGPEVLEIEEVPVPGTGAGQVRIRVEAAGVNPVDVAVRTGLLVEAGLAERREVHGVGWDVAGVVEEIGAGVTGFAPGDRVIGLADRLDLPLGAYAEQIVLDAGAVAPAPARATPEQAATLPLNGLTADQALDLAGLTTGQTLLVTGAAGGVGGYAVELAVTRGLRVVAVAGAGDEELVRSLGAEFFVPRDAELGSAVRELVPGGTHGAIDAAAVGTATLTAVRNGGSLVAVLGGAAPVPLRGTRVANVWIRADGARLAELARLADEGRLTLRVAGALPLAEAAAAHERLAAGGLRGRLVLLP